MTRPKITYTESAGNYTALRGGTSCEVNRCTIFPEDWWAAVRGGRYVFYAKPYPTRHAAATAALDWRDEQDRVRIEKEEGR